MKGMHLTPIGKGAMLLEPSEGLDISAPDQYLDELMAILQKDRITRLIYDLKKIPIIDQVYLVWLQRVNSLCKLGGQKFVVANMQPTAAFTLASIMKENPAFYCALDVEKACLL